MKVTSLIRIGKEKEICDDAVYNGNTVKTSDSDDVYESVNVSWIAVADGVGGNAGGHDASSFLMDYISDNYYINNTEEDIRSILKSANEQLIRNAESIKGKEKMATTFTGMFFGTEDVKIAHAGNTRIYFLQGKYLKQRTTDHTTYHWLKMQGNYEAAERCNKSEITSCFGGGDNNLLKFLTVETLLMDEIPDIFVITSDGIHDYIDIDTFEDILNDQISDKEKTEKLLKAARENGSCDDCSVIIIRR